MVTIDKSRVGILTIPNKNDKDAIMATAYVRGGMVLINLVFNPQTAEYTFKYTKIFILIYIKQKQCIAYQKRVLPSKNIKKRQLTSSLYMKSPFDKAFLALLVNACQSNSTHIKNITVDLYCCRLLEFLLSNFLLHNKP